MTAVVIKPPAALPPPGTPSVFLAGTIEMGVGPDWQAEVTTALSDLDVTVLNPRRDAWDASWEQRADAQPFRGQVDWELGGLGLSSVAAFYFVPGTRSPVTLMELGLFAASGRCVVCCPEGFWRKGNVDVVCERWGIERATDIDDLVARVRKRLAARRVYVVCPVRNADPEITALVAEHVQGLESAGYVVHYPPRDVDQGDPTGVGICRDHLAAMRQADEVHVFWDPASAGSHFDLGMAWALGKRVSNFRLLRDDVPGKSYAKVLRAMADNLLDDEKVV